MHTGYDNYWMCNRQEMVPNLLKNGNTSRGLSLDSYKQIQDERQPSLLTRYLSSQNNIINKNQNILADHQMPPQYSWTPTICAQPSRPYNYQNGPAMQQKDPRRYYQRLARIENRSNIPQINNNVTHLEGQNINNPTQTPRIRVRDVNSLNNLARNSMLNGMQFDSYTNCPYNVNERQQNLPQKSNTEHANHIPSLFEVNPFQPAYQRPTSVPKQSVCQEPFGAQPKRREPFISGNQYHQNNISRNEQSNEIPTSLLEELLNFTRTQLDTLQDAETPQNPPTVNNNIAAPNATKDNNLTFTNLLENSYSAGQSSYRNPPPYSETLPRIEVPLTTQQSSMPLIEPISPPLIESNVTQPPAQPIRVTAVISLPNLSSINSNNSSHISVPYNDGSSNTPDSTTKESENSTSVVPDTVPNNEDLKVKEEPMLRSSFSSEKSNIEIIIQTMKTEIIQDENVQKTENNKEQYSSINNKDRNADISKKNQTQKDKPSSGTDATEPKTKSLVSDVKLESNYKSKINRDKLDRLIEFLNCDKAPPYIDEQNSEKCNGKKQKQIDGKEKVSKSPSEKTLNMKEPVSGKVPRVEITRCSSEPSQNVTNDDSVKKTQHNSGLEKQSELNGNSEKDKTKNDKKSVCENTEKKDNSKEKKKKKKIKNNSLNSENQTEIAAKIKNSQKIRSDVTQTENCLKKENILQDNQPRVLSLPTLEENEAEKSKNNETLKNLKPESKLPSPATKTPKSPMIMELFHDTEGTGKGNLRIFSNFNYHFCEHCSIVSPSEWFWINAVTGDLKCLNCFKIMNLDSVETSHKLLMNDGKDPEPSAETPKSPGLKNTPAGDSEKQTNQKINNNETKQPKEFHKEKRKSVDESLCHEKKEKKRKPDEKSDKKVEQTKGEMTNEDKSRKSAECLKINKCKRSLSEDESQSPKGEEQRRKNSTDQIGRSASKEKQEVRPAEGHVGKKRRNSKDEICCKKIRVVEEITEEECAESHANEKLKRLKECNQRVKTSESDEVEKRRKSASKEKDIPVDKEKKVGDDKKTKQMEKNCHKTLLSLFEDSATKPLKEKQNTKMRFEKPREKQKKLEGMGKCMKDDGGEKKKGEKKSSCIKGPLQYKDFVLNKATECCFPEMMESFPLRKIMGVSRKSYSGRNEERCANLFAKLKKKTKSLSLNLLKDS